MIQEVKFQGLSHSPSDYEAQDGELGTCLNLICEDGALKPIPKPEVVDSNITIPDGAIIELVHKVTHGKAKHDHYIIRKSDDTWYWTERGGDGTANIIDIGGFHVNAVTAIGNILCFVCNSQTIYAFWKKEKAEYSVFSRVNFDFSIELGFEDSDKINYPIIKAELGEDFFEIFDYAPEFGTNSIKSIPANKVIKAFSALDSDLNRQIEKLGKEYLKYNTFAVFAVRLYDGTLYNISNIYKINSDYGTIGEVYANANEKYLFSSSFTNSMIAYNVKVNIDNLEKVYDLIQGIDVYLTRGESFIDTDKAINDITITDDSHKQGKFYFHYMNPDVARNAIDNMTFYHSVFIDKTQFGKTIPIKRVVGTEESILLANLYRSDIGGMCSITYNNRLHIANVNNGNISLKNTKRLSSTEIFQYNGIIKVESRNDTLWWKGDFINIDFNFVNVPVLEVQKITIYRQIKDSGAYSKATIVPYSSNTMGYSFYVTDSDEYGISFNLPWEIATKEEWDKISEEYNSSKNDSNIECTPSLIKVSEVENPLIFPAKNSVQIGSSSINALAANTQPISEGQFGEAPLYAFTNEGVWVLMLNTEGTYVSRQPANREICNNSNGILQIDNAVLFPTKRGIMLQEGLTCKCITDQLEGYPFDFTQLYKSEYATKVLAVGNISESEVKYVRLREFLQSASMIYDYYDSRIILFNPSFAYAYVYSLKSKLWGVMENVFNKRVNIYPESYATNKEGKILNAYIESPTDNVPYFLCSRPLTLSGKEVYKTMFTCIARGYFRNVENGKCGMVLYGSNDLYNWFLIDSSVNKYLRGMAGSPYKYFRIAIIGSLSADESISGLSTEFQERWQNKLR